MIKKMLGPARAPFLLLGPVCVAVGAGVADWRGARLSLWELLLVLIGAVAAHVAVNALNEYSDFKSRLDERTQRTPFSGGSGTLQADPSLAGPALTMALAALGLAALVGIYFLVVRGPGLLPVGLLGLVIVVIYTVWLTHSPLLCLLAPGIGFGVLMVLGTEFSLSGAYSWAGLIASLVPTCLVSNLLLLNQFPDADADRTVGRRHLPIVAGRRTSSLVYAALLAGCYAAIVAGVLVGQLPLTALLGLLTLVLAVPAARGAYRHADDIGALVPYMGHNVLITLLTPLLLAVGLFIG